jgi:hypothetical protein
MQRLKLVRKGYYWMNNKKKIIIVELVKIIITVEIIEK